MDRDARGRDPRRGGSLTTRVPDGTTPAPGDEADWPIPWRRNLVAVWIAQATGIFGFWFCLPFLPLFLEHDLSVRHGPELAFWSGTVTATAGFGQFVTSPFWGALSDRFGRKAMLLRAMLLGSLTVGLMGFCRNPLDLAVLRFLQGASSGVTAAGTTLVATGTPRSHVGWALGISGSAVAIGAAAGPVVGGAVESAVGPRWVFWVGGALLLLAAAPVVALVREFRANLAPRVTSGRAAGERLPRPLLRALAFLLVAVAMVQVSYSAALPLVPLLAIGVAGPGAGAVTGAAFTAAGIGSVAGAVAYAWPAQRFGYRTVVMAAALAGAASMTGLALASGVVVIVLAMFATGFFFNAATTAVNAMLGLQTPGPIQGRVFGFAASAIAVGYTIGPVMAGIVGATLGVRTGLLTAAAAAILLFALAVWGLREPAR